MHRKDFYIAVSTVICAFGVSACAAAAGNLQPASVGKARGAAFGRLMVFSHNIASGENLDVTATCYAKFTDDNEAKKQYLKLDGTGWIFTAIDPGPTYLSSVVCSSGTLDTRDLKFEVPSGGKIVYFGHVSVILPIVPRPGEVDSVAVGSAIGGVLGATIAGAALIGAANSIKPDPSYRVNDNYDEAVTQYLTRYGSAAGALEPVVAIAAKLALMPPPTQIAGFLVGNDVATAEASCTGAGLAWQKLVTVSEALSHAPGAVRSQVPPSDTAKSADGRFSCSGAPTKLGMPVAVTLTTSRGTVSDIAVNASPDRAQWRELRERFSRLTQLLEGNYGTQHLRETNWLECAADGLERCLDLGRVRISERWSWSDGQSVSVVLDGGAVGATPTLYLEYKSALPHEKL